MLGAWAPKYPPAYAHASLPFKQKLLIFHIFSLKKGQFFNKLLVNLTRSIQFKINHLGIPHV